jgi:hypothetical protein
MFKTRNYVKDLVDILFSFILRVVKKRWQHVPSNNICFIFKLLNPLLFFVVCKNDLGFWTFVIHKKSLGFNTFAIFELRFKVPIVFN